jgi:hypothetical protein
MKDIIHWQRADILRRAAIKIGQNHPKCQALFLSFSAGWLAGSISTNNIDVTDIYCWTGKTLEIKNVAVHFVPTNSFYHKLCEYADEEQLGYQPRTSYQFTCLAILEGDSDGDARHASNAYEVKDQSFKMNGDSSMAIEQQSSIVSGYLKDYTFDSLGIPELKNKKNSMIAISLDIQPDEVTIVLFGLELVRAEASVTWNELNLD